MRSQVSYLMTWTLHLGRHFTAGALYSGITRECARDGLVALPPVLLFLCPLCEPSRCVLPAAPYPCHSCNQALMSFPQRCLTIFHSFMTAFSRLLCYVSIKPLFTACNCCPNNGKEGISLQNNVYCYYCCLIPHYLIKSNLYSNIEMLRAMDKKPLNWLD